MDCCSQISRDHVGITERIFRNMLHRHHKPTRLCAADASEKSGRVFVLDLLTCRLVAVGVDHHHPPQAYHRTLSATRHRRTDHIASPETIPDVQSE
ncbi:hypothetical protein PHSY_000016 [Pseudozyma hubeiensis SY62]|uniref:Uncharacterized protein n=1 Tax=Pseudozyma hubeiensis (strain SY62) TaxID=1305764 RepID=R9NVI9_PSEHS|nr:hypothetical protein PHSY_000016 [Pseudozyma hubeiensis SY62]GAC92463.1 hypothetical protein PHSY_000016 [Pseudozyma hubeiensis SY62]